MSHLNELIEVLCPHGVDYIPMWQITTWDKKFNAVDRAKQPEVRKYEYLLASEIKDLNVNGGDVKLLTTNESDLWTTQLVADRTIYDAEIIAIPWGGNAIVQHYNGKFITSDNRIAIARNPKVLDMKFLYYFISNHLDVLATFYRGSGIKHPNMAKVLDWPIPVPPIEVQQEIVRILDNFTALEAELEAELEARKKQYEFYRRQLLSFGDDVEWSTLGDISLKVISGGTPSSGDSSYYGGSIPWLRTQEVDFRDIHTTSMTITDAGLKNSSAKWIPANCVIIAMYGATAAKSAVNSIPLTTNQACCNLEINPDKADFRYVFHWVSNSYEKLRSLGEGSQSNINSKKVKSFPIALPSLEVQRSIVRTLDKFDTLVNDLSSGLPAEIAARRKQYEYYRDQLLTFKELSS